MNGGYVMINAAGVNAADGDGVKISGIYQKVYRAMSLNKPVFFNNILSGENGIYTPLLGACLLADTTITVIAAEVKFTITEDDTVTMVR